VELYTPITKWADRLGPANLAEALGCSWQAAVQRRPGPIFWSFASADAEREMPPGAPPPEAWDDRSIESTGPMLGAAMIRIQAARRPLLVVGIGVARDGVDRELVALAEHLGCPVVVTQQVKGWFPEDHSLFAGTFGLYRDEPLCELMEEADLIVAVGLDGADFYKRWRAATPVVSLADGEADDATFQPTVASDGDLAEQLRRARELTGRSDWPEDRATTARRAIVEIIRPRGPHAPDGDGQRMPPQVAISELRRAFPRDGILTVDVGSHKLVVVQQWRTSQPNSFICSNGLSPMGTGLPFAIGAQLERPDTPVACVLGDGGFLMYTGELETVARLKLPILLLL
ncbi:MAG: thiamine pyrophosphate-dependent enzyme, partial [Chloroflexi bacterium]|nr:thiamine pyrophosphate-dependent enzyme [Chloroflexota bacterium]